MTKLAQFANAQTPSDVKVEAEPSSLALWVLRAWGPWGAILIMTVALWYAYSAQVQQTIKIQADHITQLEAENASMRTMIQTMSKAMEMVAPK